jgi:hypothetical protein
MPRKYEPVNVSWASTISRTVRKDIVIIVSVDLDFDKTHVTTYGRHEKLKDFAAELGEKCMKAIGCDLSKGETFEDFRATPAAEAQAAIEKANEQTSELARLLRGASQALRSYQYGNSSPDLAEEMANACDDTLRKVETFDLSQMGLSGEQLDQVAKLAEDMASFKGISLEEAMKTVRTAWIEMGGDNPST